MCVNKRLIRNSIQDSHRTGFDKEYISVPCCSCPECRKQKANDWLFRSYWEFLYQNKQSFFITLTYDDEHLPYHNGKPCFDSEHIKFFLHRLRYYVPRFRYFSVCEYGSFLKRPHYHFLILPSEFVSREKLYKGIQSAWYYGSISSVDPLTSVQSNAFKAISYLVKYTTKDCTFPNDFDRSKDSRYMPRVRASKGFGDGFLKYCTEDVLKQGFYWLPVGNNGTSVKFSIPRYYELKLCYDYSWDSSSMKASLIRNDLGTRISVDRHNSHYVTLIEKFYASRNDDIKKIISLPGSFGDSSWKSLVLSCFKDFEDFKEFMFYRPFIYKFNYHLRYNPHPSVVEVPRLDPVFGSDDDPYYYAKEYIPANLFPSGDGYYIDSLREVDLYRPKWQHYHDVLSQYERYLSVLDNAKSVVLERDLLRSEKLRTRFKLRNNLQYRSYLLFKGVDLSYYLT